MRSLYLLASCALLLGCPPPASDEHGHDHGEGHDHGIGHEGEHEDGHGHAHADEHPRGHNHHQPGHGHGETAVTAITIFGAGHELFAEHGPAVAGQPLEFLAHLTRLEDHSPVSEATLELELEGPATLRAQQGKALRPGIFTLRFTPQKPGEYRGKLLVQGAERTEIEGLTLTVHASAQAAAKAAPAGLDEDAVIELLKEQQWGVPFGIAEVERGALVASIEVAGTVDTPPGGSAVVGAAVAGRLVAPREGLPRPGQSVRKGQLLATLAPAPSSPEGAARAQLAIVEADARATAAHVAVERARRLIKEEAISRRELEDAEREAQVAEQAVSAARRAAALFSGATGGGGAGSWKLIAPIAGTLASVKATPGSSVAQGDVLFHIVNADELWIRAKVPEQDAARFRSDRDAHFKLPGTEQWLPISLGGEAPSASLVSVSRTVDEVARTVDVIYALREPDARLRVGGLLRVSLPAGDDFEGLVVPESALIEVGGRTLVYSQVDGEHFEERAVALGPRSGSRVGIARGLDQGQRVVVRGAEVVRLAARADSAGGGHGHVH
ncbi:MAG: efflux RND transporter periplasmic adaptor subunit [Myxococcales bacterium]|nr:efflux RND transporter periplasmic adaptor subunit [Myxococcales bacterium]